MNDKSELFYLGLNYNGQLDVINNKDDYVEKFTKLNLPFESFKDFTCGFNYLIVLTKEGDVYYSGQLFLGNNNFYAFSYKIFTKLNLSFCCEQISRSNNNIYFLTNKNEIYDILNAKYNFTKQVNELYSNFNTECLFIVTKNNDIYKLQEKKFEKVEQIWNFPYLLLCSLEKYLIVLNYNEDYSKKEKRMKALLLKQINFTHFTDITFN